MTISEEVFAIIEKPLRTEKQGLNANQIHALCPKFTKMQIYGAINNLAATEKPRLRKIAGEGKPGSSLKGEQRVAYTLIGLPLTAHLPEYHSEEMARRSKIANITKRNHGPVTIANSDGQFISGQSASADVVLELLDANPSLNRGQFLEVATQKLGFLRSSAAGIVLKMLKANKLFLCGSQRNGKLIRTGKLANANITFSERQLAELARANPAMPYVEFLNRVELVLGSSTEAYNRVHGAISKELISVVDEIIVPFDKSHRAPVAPATPAVEPVKAAEATVTYTAASLGAASTSVLTFTEFEQHINALAQSIANTITAQVAQALNASLAKLVLPVVEVPAIAAPTFQKPVETAKPSLMVSAQQAKPKIAVVGLKGILAAEMQQEFPDVDFSFFDAESIGRISKSIEHMDHVYGMTKFIGHASDDHMKKHQNYHRIPGGLTGLKQAVRSLQLHS